MGRSGCSRLRIGRDDGRLPLFVCADGAAGLLGGTESRGRSDEDDRSEKTGVSFVRLPLLVTVVASVVRSEAKFVSVGVGGTTEEFCSVVRAGGVAATGRTGADGADGGLGFERSDIWLLCLICTICGFGGTIGLGFALLVTCCEFGLLLLALDSLLEAGMVVTCFSAAVRIRSASSSVIVLLWLFTAILSRSQMAKSSLLSKFNSFDRS